MSDTSEQRSLPPSAKKLLDARKKGQVAHSRDLVSAAGTVAAIAYLWSWADSIADRWRETLIFSASVQNEPLQIALPRLGSILTALFFNTVIPLFAVVILAGLLANVAMNRGLIFSFEPMIPKLEHINPFTGFKRIFGLKNWVEFTKTLVKTLLLGCALTLVLLGTLNTLVRLPICGETCIGFVFGGIAKLLLAISAGFFLATGLIDVLLQRWLFLRDMRMTKTEAKREHQDQEGNPLIRSTHRRHREELAKEPPLGISRATLLLRGDGLAVGLRYIRGQTAVPVVVCRARGPATITMAEFAESHGIPLIADTELASGLRRRPRIGAPVPSQQFERIARAMIAAGAVT